MKNLKKAKEEGHLDSYNKKKFREARKEFSKDPLASQLTPIKGVSQRGIEARRGDLRIKGPVSHGYNRVFEDPAKHLESAKNQYKTKPTLTPNRGAKLK